MKYTTQYYLNIDIIIWISIKNAFLKSLKYRLLHYFFSDFKKMVQIWFAKLFILELINPQTSFELILRSNEIIVSIYVKILNVG